MCSSLPSVFQQLIRLGCLTPGELAFTDDGFVAGLRSLGDIMTARSITTWPGDRDEARSVLLFFDDWYLYTVPGENGPVCSLLKMREQEYDAVNGLTADGDTPGVTIAFIAFDTASLINALEDPSFDKVKALTREISRTVSAEGQTHHPDLKAYFCRVEAQGPYLAAELYVRFLAGLSVRGALPVPVCLQSTGISGKARIQDARLARFVDKINALAGRLICDHREIRLRDADALDENEKRLILALHTADTSCHAFAAEVRFHACFLTKAARLTLPLTDHSVYASALRADMSVNSSVLENAAPFRHEGSLDVRRQAACHRDYLRHLHIPAQLPASASRSAVQPSHQ